MRTKPSSSARWRPGPTSPCRSWHQHKDGEASRPQPARDKIARRGSFRPLGHPDLHRVNIINCRTAFVVIHCAAFRKHHTPAFCAEKTKVALVCPTKVLTSLHSGPIPVATEVAAPVGPSHLAQKRANANPATDRLAGILSWKAALGEAFRDTAGQRDRMPLHGMAGMGNDVRPGRPWPSTAPRGGRVSWLSN